MTKEGRGSATGVRRVVSTRSLAAIGVLAASLIGAPATWAAGPTAPTAGTGVAQVRAVCPAPAPGYATCFALVRAPVAPGTPESASASPYAVDSGASSPGPAGGLTPEQLAGAYGYAGSGGGAGQTIAIADAFNDPEIENDLGVFDTRYKLAPCTTANGCFKKVGQTGSTSLLPANDTSGWSVEISLDVETVHAVCPKCRILLVEAKSASFANLATAVNEAVALGATEVSNSYGGPEAGVGEQERAAYNHPGVPIVDATGDDGYYGWTSVNEGFFGPEMPNAPASFPTVVAVGGTSLRLNADGTRASETVWNDNGPNDDVGLTKPGLGATGGGCSTLFTAQLWQLDLPGFAATGCESARLDADVSAVADPLTGFDLYDSYKCGGETCEFPRVEGGWATFGGTSLSTPLISGLYALAGGGGGVKYPALTLYGHAADASSRFDVTSGGNSICGGTSVVSCADPNSVLGLVDCEGTTACNAAPGFDGPSGVGAPSGLGLFEPLLPTASISAVGISIAGGPTSFRADGSSDPYPGGSISSSTWNWGDGSSTTAGGVSTAHTYAAPGTYTVSLMVTDNYGLSSASTATVVHVAAFQPAPIVPIPAPGSPSTAGVSANTGVTGVAGAQESAPVVVPDAKLASTALAASASGAVSITITCPEAEASCSGTVTLRTMGALVAGAGSANATAAVLTLAKGSFKVAGGKVKRITLHLSVKARALLRHSHVMHVSATIVAHDRAGATHTTRTVATLRSPKAKPGKG